MINPEPYINSLVFEVEYLVKGQLLHEVATYYHETIDTIKQTAEYIACRNNWQVISITSINKEGRRKSIWEKEKMKMNL